VTNYLVSQSYIFNYCSDRSINQSKEQKSNHDGKNIDEAQTPPRDTIRAALTVLIPILLVWLSPVVSEEMVEEGGVAVEEDNALPGSIPIIVVLVLSALPAVTPSSPVPAC